MLHPQEQLDHAHKIECAHAPIVNIITDVANFQRKTALTQFLLQALDTIDEVECSCVELHSFPEAQ